MTLPVLSPEQRALRERQGPGARYDSPAAPHSELLLARRGTAYFLRKLTEMPDEMLDLPSLLPGWTRRMIVAHVGHSARATARSVEDVHKGAVPSMHESDSHRRNRITFAATLPARALRHLVEHSAVHLHVAWRDLHDASWDRMVVSAHGRSVPIRETAWMRARDVWVHSIDLGSGGSFENLPAEMNDRIIDDVFRVWTRRGETMALTLVSDDRPPETAVKSYGRGGPVVYGDAANLALWLARQIPNSLSVAGGGTLPDIPRWFRL